MTVKGFLVKFRKKEQKKTKVSPQSANWGCRVCEGNQREIETLKRKLREAGIDD
jgi:hypothetical protein